MFVALASGSIGGWNLCYKRDIRESPVVIQVPPASIITPVIMISDTLSSLRFFRSETTSPKLPSLTHTIKWDNGIVKKGNIGMK